MTDCARLASYLKLRGFLMPRVCKFTGRKTHVGNTYTHRGKAKYLGGVGTKVTGKTKRTFKPNLQKVRAVVDGVATRVRTSTKAMRDGHIVKPLKRKYAYKPAAAEVAAA
jgi:large subunit ribosomal protein L28